MKRGATATLVCVAAATLFVACGSGGSITRLRPNGPITHAEAIAVAQAIGLRHADAPTLKETAGRGKEAPEREEVDIASCSGGESPALRVASASSPTLQGGSSLSPFYVASFVVVWPTAALASKARMAAESTRGLACYERALAKEETYRIREGRTIHIGAAHVSRLPAPILGAPSIAFQSTATSAVTFPGTAARYVAPFYVDTLAAEAGPIHVAVAVQGYGKTPPLALAQQILSRVYNRAKAHVV